MYYHFETGINISFCYVKLADKNEVADALAALSQFTLRGSKLKVGRYDRSRNITHFQQDLAAGWLPSPSSDLALRVPRPPITSPPKLLPPLLAVQWVLFSNLPPLDPSRKGARFEMLREFYKKFHSYDVVGITAIRKHRVVHNGWVCKILFGNHKDALLARKTFLKGLFMGRKSRARFYRSGPNVHQLLWKYRESLPEDTPESEVGTLLEKKYKELVIQDKPWVQRLNHPTPASAVGLIEDLPTSS